MRPFNFFLDRFDITKLSENNRETNGSRPGIHNNRPFQQELLSFRIETVASNR